jgi:Tol biopolymer transport system component
MKETGSKPEPVPITLLDDHGNEYKGELVIDLTSEPLTIGGTSYHGSGPGGGMLLALPVGFAFVENFGIPVPKEAAIKQIRFGDFAPRDFSTLPLTDVRLLGDFGRLTWKKGQGVDVGKWLNFTFNGFEPSMGVGWDVLVGVRNKEYNSQEAAVQVGVQYRDGAIHWGSEKKDVKGSSETGLAASLVLPVWTKQGPPQPVALLLMFENVPENARDFRIVPLGAEDIPPRIGQGADEQDFQVFENAYRARQGREDLGKPTSYVSWFGGKDKPRDEKDVLVQHFRGSSQLGRAAILWDKQGGAKDAYVIHGPAWEQYLEEWKSGKSRLGSPIHLYKSPETGFDQFDFEGGYMASIDGHTLEVYSYEDGKIAFVSDRDGNREIYVTDPAGKVQRNLTRNPANDMSPAWSPDGTKVAFVSDRDGRGVQFGVYVMDADGSNVRQLASEGEDPCWFPDGATIAFVRKVRFRERSAFGGQDRSDEYYGLFTVGLNGAEKQVPIDPRKVRKHRNGDWQGNIRHPNVSLDGKTVAFSAGSWDSGHEYEIELFKVASKTVVAPDPLSARRGGMGCDFPRASRDGKKLAFRSDTGYCEEVAARGGRIYGGQLHWMDLAGRITKVCEQVWCWGGLDWSADCNAIVFSGNGREGRMRDTNLCLIRLDRRVARYITHDKGNNYDPSWWTSGVTGKPTDEEAETK